MSTLVTKNLQIGADGTASNNFTVYQPVSPDGTLRIGNGNSGTTSDQVALTSAGNVGIGTTAPGAKLDVQSSTTFIQFTHPSFGDVGKINASGDNIAFDATVVTNLAGIRLASGGVYPRKNQALSDDGINLGGAGQRWQDIYAGNATIITSDRNEKQDIEALSDAEQRVAVAAKSLLRKFRWKSAVAEKGDEARIHFGIIAQDLQAAFAAEGLDAGRYAMFIHSTWTDEETGEERNRMGVRYSELLAFIVAAI